jgi:hypothetical protein
MEGILVIDLVCGTNLASRDKNGLSDPVVKVIIFFLDLKIKSNY